MKRNSYKELISTHDILNNAERFYLNSAGNEFDRTIVFKIVTASFQFTYRDEFPARPCPPIKLGIISSHDKRAWIPVGERYSTQIASRK